MIKVRAITQEELDEFELLSVEGDWPGWYIAGSANTYADEFINDILSLDDGTEIAIHIDDDAVWYKLINPKPPVTRQPEQVTINFGRS